MFFIYGWKDVLEDDNWYGEMNCPNCMQKTEHMFKLHKRYPTLFLMKIPLGKVVKRYLVCTNCGANRVVKKNEYKIIRMSDSELTPRGVSYDVNQNVTEQPSPGEADATAVVYEEVLSTDIRTFDDKQPSESDTDSTGTKENVIGEGTPTISKKQAIIANKSHLVVKKREDIKPEEANDVKKTSLKKQPLSLDQLFKSYERIMDEKDDVEELPTTVSEFANACNERNARNSRSFSLKKFFEEYILTIVIGLLCLWGIYSYLFGTAVSPNFDEESQLYGFRGRLGFTAISPMYEDIIEKDSFNDNVFWVKKDGFWGAINKKNKIIVPFEYETEKSYLKTEELNELTRNGKHGLIAEDGTILIPFEYDEAFIFDENNVTLAIKDGKVGAINIENETLIPFDYEVTTKNPIYAFKQDKIVFLKKNNKIGAIDNNGETVISFEYDLAYTENTLYDGEPYTLCLTDTSDFYRHGVIVLKKNNKCGVLDKDNKIIIPFDYDKIFFIDKTFSAYNSQGHFEFDINGKLIES